MYVVRTEHHTRPLRYERPWLHWHCIRWKNPGAWRFDTFVYEATAQAAGAEVYRFLFEIKGSWTERPTHAVHAEWQVNDPTLALAFEESRRRLFELRRLVLATFASDWLLKRLDLEGRYIVLGQHGDEEGARRLCRERPEIRRFAQLNPVKDFEAVDLAGLLCFRVEALAIPGGLAKRNPAPSTEGNPPQRPFSLDLHLWK